MKSLNSIEKNFFKLSLAYPIAFVSVFCISFTVFANPVLDHVVAGSVSVQQVPNSTIVNQSSTKAIINWQSFNMVIKKLPILNSLQVGWLIIVLTQHKGFHQFMAS